MTATPKGRRLALASLIPAAVVAIWLLSATGIIRAGSTSSAAPAIKVTLDDGRTLDLMGSDQVLVLNFYASWCPPCRDEAPALRSVARAVEDDDRVLMLGIAYQDSPASAGDYRDDYQLAYPNITDDGGRIARAFHVGGIPRTFVIDRSGRVVFSHFGAIRSDQLLGAIEEALLP